ncbi:MAG: aminotransferase class V-fold PLP-dependent enzyme [Pseudomonadota bacterium]
MIASADRFGPALLALFQLEPGVAHLNHGSYGATPRAVRQAQRDWQARMEAAPTRFFDREHRPAIRAAAARLAPLIGAHPDDVALVENATQAVNAVLRSYPFDPGDRILVNSQTYGAVRNAAAYVAARTGARLESWDLPFPVSGAEEIAAAFEAALDPAPRLVVLDHVVSDTALKLPLARLVRAAKGVGAAVLVDGAHAPGMIEIDVQTLGADWYAGNCHKWMFAAKGCAFLWARDGAELHPTVISHGFGDGFHAEFDYVGTRDASAQHALPAALDFMARFGVETLQARNHALAVEAGSRLAAAWGSETGAPAELIGAMAVVRLPYGAEGDFGAAQRLRDRLLDEDGIQVRLHPLAGGLWARVSLQIYNDLADIDRLAEAVLAKRPNA